MSWARDGQLITVSNMPPSASRFVRPASMRLFPRTGWAFKPLLAAKCPSCGSLLKPDREQLPNAQDHQERDKAYRQRLPYFGGFWLNRGSDHLPTLV